MMADTGANIHLVCPRHRHCMTDLVENPGVMVDTAAGVVSSVVVRRVAAAVVVAASVAIGGGGIALEESIECRLAVGGCRRVGRVG